MPRSGARRSKGSSASSERRDGYTLRGLNNKKGAVLSPYTVPIFGPLAWIDVILLGKSLSLFDKYASSLSLTILASSRILLKTSSLYDVPAIWAASELRVCLDSGLSILESMPLILSTAPQPVFESF